MMLIEPCCTQRHWPMLRKKLGQDGTEQFEGYGDLSISELLPVILLSYSETDMMVVAPTLPDHAARTLHLWLRKQWATIDGRRVDVVSRMTIIADLSAGKSPIASGWLTKNPFPGRLTLKNIRQSDTAIIFPDLALHGPINMTYGHRFTATATKNAATIEELREAYQRL